LYTGLKRTFPCRRGRERENTKRESEARVSLSLWTSVNQLKIHEQWEPSARGCEGGGERELHNTGTMGVPVGCNTPPKTQRKGGRCVSRTRTQRGGGAGIVCAATEFFRSGGGVGVERKREEKKHGVRK